LTLLTVCTGLWLIPTTMRCGSRMMVNKCVLNRYASDSDFGPLTSLSAVSRRLNDYGFTKIRKGGWVHPSFYRGTKLLSFILRKQSKKQTSVPSTPQPMKRHNNKKLIQSFAKIQAQRSSLIDAINDTKSRLVQVQSTQTNIQADLNSVKQDIDHMRAQLISILSVANLCKY